MHALHHALANEQVAPAGPAKAKDSSAGYDQIAAMVKHRGAQTDPVHVAAVIEQHPQETQRIIEFLHSHLGNGFTQKVMKAQHAGDKSDKSDDGQIHIITEAGLRHLRESGHAGQLAAKELFDNPDAYIVLKAGQHMPEGWKGNATMLFPSYASFEAAAHGGQLPNNLKAVVYDNEHWDQTPLNEKQDASKYAKKFGELAHALGLTFIAAPTRKWFADDAKYADIIDVQLQDREAHTRSYGKALAHDVQVAHHENPDVKVVGQITSSVRHLDPTHTGRGQQGIDKAEHDITANADGVDGFWDYIYQKNDASIDAGVQISKDLADDKRKGAKI